MIYRLKIPLHCSDDVTYHVTQPVQRNGLFYYRSLYERGFRIRSTSLHYTALTSHHPYHSTDLQCTASTTMQPHYSTAYHFTAPPQLHCTAFPLLHCTSLHRNPTTPINNIALHSLECIPKVPLHFNAPPVHFAALQPHYYIEFHCTPSTKLLPNYSTELHPLHFNTTTPLHFITLYNVFHQRCMPLYFTAR